MTTSDDRAIALLQTLLRVYRDGVEGYATADRELTDPEIGREVGAYRQERIKLITDVEQRLRDLRAHPGTESTPAGAAHRKWMEARAARDPDPVAALLTEIERGEDLAVGALRRGLEEHDIDAATRRLLETHYERVQAAHDRVKQLRDRCRVAPGVRERAG